MSACAIPPAGWRCTRDAGHDGPCAAVPIDDAVDLEARLREAEAHLWALVVWFDGYAEGQYAIRDMRAAAAYVEQHLAEEDMTTRHRAVMAALTEAQT